MATKEAAPTRTVQRLTAQAKLLSRRLAVADAAFAEGGNCVEALLHVALAAKHGVPVPPKIGKWLHQAIWEYRRGAKLEAALGLSRTGAANPRRSLYLDVEKRSALTEMATLVALGATVEQAAKLAARLSPTFKESTLSDRFRRSGLGDQARADRKLPIFGRSTAGIDAFLRLFPNDNDTPKIKDKLRAVYAKRHP